MSQQSRAYIAPAGTSLQEMMDSIRYSVTHGRGYMHMSDAQGELLYRVNANLKGDNPGEPMNWAGERGLRR
jgi:hypothetical protein